MSATLFVIPDAMKNLHLSGKRCFTPFNMTKNTTIIFIYKLSTKTKKQ